MTTITLYIIKADGYVLAVDKIVTESLKKGPLVYVTASKPYVWLKRHLSGMGIDESRVFFIDCSTGKADDKTRAEPSNVLSLDGPQNLTSLSIAIGKAITRVSPNGTLFLDSLSVLSLYNDVGTVSKFANFLFTRLRSLEVSAVVLGIEVPSGMLLIDEISALADEVKRA